MGDTISPPLTLPSRSGHHCLYPCRRADPYGCWWRAAVSPSPFQVGCDSVIRCPPALGGPVAGHLVFEFKPERETRACVAERGAVFGGERDRTVPGPAPERFGVFGIGTELLLNPFGQTRGGRQRQTAHRPGPLLPRFVETVEGLGGRFLPERDRTVEGEPQRFRSAGGELIGCFTAAEQPFVAAGHSVDGRLETVERAVRVFAAAVPTYVAVQRLQTDAGSRIVRVFVADGFVSDPDVSRHCRPADGFFDPDRHLTVHYLVG